LKKITFLLVLTLAAGAAPALPAKARPTPVRPAAASPVHYGIPRLAPGQLWVASVPVGLEVRLGDDPRVAPVGRTPLVVDARKAGTYVTVTLRKSEAGGRVPIQTDLADFTYAKSGSAGTQDEATGKIEYADLSLTYRTRLPDKQTVIALFQTRRASPAEIDRLYPPGSNFRFPDEIVRASLTGRGVSPDLVRSAISRLHRGGKVAVQSKEGWLVVEATASGMVEVIDESAERLR
jgi:hypothetical protein